MKPVNKKTVFLFLFFIVVIFQLFPCSGFVVSDNGRVWFANGEDWHDYDSCIAFYPAEKNGYGRINFEFAWPLPFVPGYITDFGGINDQGLAFDEYAHADKPLVKGQERPRMTEEITRYCLRNCATVEEVLNVYSKYYVPELRDHQSMYADKTGNSVIIEGDDVIHKSGDYQICTNFLQSGYPDGVCPCSRYNSIDNFLKKDKEISIDNMKWLLKGVSNPGPYSPTQYSSIYNLTDGTFLLYYFHNFDEYIYIDIDKELKKGKRRFYLPSLFAYIQPVFPADGDIIEGKTAKFEWTGSDTGYELFYSENSDFSGSASVKISRSGQSVNTDVRYAIFVLLFLPAGLFQFFRKKGRKRFSVFLLILIVFSCTTIHKVNPREQIGNYTVTVENLKPGTAYYWKIEANASGSFISTAEGGSFSVK